MESYTVIEPIFSDMMPITETTDPAHADIINAGPKQLLENTLCNRADIDRLKASTGDGADMAYNEGALYALGDYCIYKNTLYRCIVAITQAEQWNAQHWEKTNITNELLMLQRKEIELVDPMTATVAGFAADAQKTGKAIKDVSANLGSLSTTVNSLSTMVAKKADASTVNTALADVWKKIYPVGAVYISVSATNPATLFGGTWQQITGRFLLAAGGGYAAGATGGEVAHTLTVAEMPSHTHAVANSSNGQLIGWSGHNNVSINITSWGAGNACNESKISAAGSSVAHNNMPPYLVVYMWRRTA